MSLDLRTVLCEVVLGTLSSLHFLAKDSASYTSLLHCSSVDMVLVLFHHFFCFRCFHLRVSPSVCYGTYFSLVYQPYCIFSGLLQTWHLCCFYRELLTNLLGMKISITSQIMAVTWLQVCTGLVVWQTLDYSTEDRCPLRPKLSVYHSANRVYPYRWAQLT